MRFVSIQMLLKYNYFTIKEIYVVNKLNKIEYEEKYDLILPTVICQLLMTYGFYFLLVSVWTISYQKFE